MENVSFTDNIMTRLERGYVAVVNDNQIVINIFESLCVLAKNSDNLPDRR